MKNRNLLGLVLLGLGVLLLLQALNVISGTIFFAGWWTLFLIVPAIVSMSRTGITVGNMIFLAVGVGALLTEQGWNLKGYLVPILFIVIGIGIIFKK